ncbi:hypothetical protein B0H11DRAFT_2030044 [Mycena galericulata]|nr:hypothetical protein B0H11DRAFT_2030044 [Mycena galericulata]
MSRRLHYSRILGIGAGLTLILIVYTLSGTTRHPEVPFFSSKRGGTCPPRSYADGKWVYSPRTSDTSMTSQEDALRFSGFEGCASSREYYLHLGSDNKDHWARFPDVTSWQWQPKQSGCQIQEMQALDLLRELVEQGGWLLIGDSISEGHFFSISCMLYPHVRATPDYIQNPYYDRAWAQNIYLDPSSPLIPRLNLPKGFSVESTPLVTFRRVDLLFSQQQLVDLHHRLYAEPRNFSLFGDEATWTLEPAEYLSMFTDPELNYQTLVVSTAGHWTTGLFSGYRDEGKTLFGIEGVIQFFGQAVKEWAKEVQQVVTEVNQRNPAKQRQVVVRAYLPGHEDCHNELKPYNEIKPYAWNWWNWASIGEFNEVFEEVVSQPKYPNIHFLAIDYPARLRPDAHISIDCLHIMTGAGVLEGWSHYIWHFITREVEGRTVR